MADTSAVKDASLSASMLESWKQHEPGYIQSAKEQVPSMSNKVPYQPLDGMSSRQHYCSYNYFMDGPDATFHRYFQIDNLLG